MDVDKLVLFDDSLSQLQITRGFMPQLTEETRETDIVTADELRANPNKVIAVPNEYEVEVNDLLEPGTHLETRVYYTLDLNPNFEDEEKAKEKARIAEIALTRADVFEALILARGLTKQMLRSFIELDETLNDIEKALYLNRFDDALEFYRKHPAIDFISAKLSISSDDMDKFFDTKDYTYLKPVVDEITDVEDVNGLEEESK